ncbi:MAG: 2-C-methyl-D-erythritol 4-phosphate cytidylyltransferase [Candidatus Omnitrophica bacterium]|nr:2-C-methyl-D-erythritol 4-phosphate cytidylyltransferase [Candidatus Omnitrophota bacterium]
MYVTAVVVAAGKGLRLRSKVSKPLIKINSRPIIVYSLNTLSKHLYIKDIIVVANRKNLEGIRNIIKQYHIKKVKDVVLGGRLRQDSVFNGLIATDSRTEMVLIHDAGRPFIDEEIVSSVIKAARKYKAAIVGVPAKATIKKVLGRFVKKTLDRDSLWEIQTPQVFERGLILKAYNRFGNTGATDDAMLVEKLGVKISVVAGTYKNIKITTPEDLLLAQAIAKSL